MSNYSKDFKGNYKNEKEFQSDFIKHMKSIGYWVYKFPDVGFTLKPFDIIALIGGKAMAIELKYGDVNTYDKIYKMLRPNQVGGLKHFQEHGGTSWIVGWDKKENVMYHYPFKYKKYEGAL